MTIWTWPGRSSRTPGAVGADHRAASSAARRKDDASASGRSFGALFVSLLLLAVLGGGVYWGMGVVENNQSFKEFVAADYDSQRGRRRGHRSRFRRARAAPEIANLLLDKGIVESATAFVEAWRRTAAARTSSPAYKLKLRSPAADRPHRAARPGEQADQPVHRSREGLTVIETLAKLAEADRDPGRRLRGGGEGPGRARHHRRLVRPAGRQAGGDASIEGFLFPDTYGFDPAASATDILKMMVDQFLKVADDVECHGAGAGELGISPYEALIVASLAQAEAGKDEDFAKVARVAYNRAYKELIDCALPAVRRHRQLLAGAQRQADQDIRAT